MALSRVFQPITINKIELKNRVIRSAHGTFLSATRHIGGKTWQAFHVARAKGGVGLTILEASFVHNSSAASAALDDDAIIGTYQSLMAAVRPYGMRVFQQLWHGGHLYTYEGGGPSWGVSAVPSVTGVMPEAMTIAQIRTLQEAYVAAALRCKAGGLDGVEFHSAHGYLPTQFYSPVLNRRTDQYGGSLENRMRFTLETLRKLRAAIGPDYVMGMRIGAAKTIGVTEADLQTIIRTVEGEGLIDYLNASMGDYYRHDDMTGAMNRPTGFQLPSSSQLTAVSRLPRIVVGRFRTLEEVEQVLKDGVADLVSMVRAHIADPDLVRKTMEGRVSEIRPCIGCNQGCIGGLYRHGQVGCAVNPAAGFEDTLAEDLIEKTATPRRVLVIGGGPAGMEAARVAALRGHKVKLIEASADLGGLINIAKRAPRLHSFGDIGFWLESEIYRLGVEVQLNTYADAELIRAEGADAVIIATGSSPRMDGYQMFAPLQPILGYEQRHVISSIDLLTQPKERLGKTAVVFDDVGHLEAIAAAEYLIEHGLSVTFVTSQFQFGGPYTPTTERDIPALERLYRGDFRLHTRFAVREIRRGECRIGPLQSEKTETVPADHVVLVTHNMPNRELFDTLQDEIKDIFVIGDARAPRDAQYAIWEAHRTARALA